jgi:hypothetical protein
MDKQSLLLMHRDRGMHEHMHKDTQYDTACSTPVWAGLQLLPESRMHCALLLAQRCQHTRHTSPD